MSKKILKVNSSGIDALPTHGNLFSILSTNKAKMMPWVYNTCIALQYNSKYGLSFLPFAFSRRRMYSICPFLTCHGISKSIVLKRWNSIIDFIKDAIDDGYYIEVSAWEYYIPLYDAYMKYNWQHNIFIYGYDKEFIYAADNFKNRKYAFGKISYSDITNAIPLDENSAEGNVWLYKLDDTSYTYTFDIVSFKKNIYDYINSSYSDVHNSFFFDEELIQTFNSKLGFGVYDGIINDIKDIDNIDIRIFCVLKDHKKIVKESLEYLKSKNYLPLYFDTERYGSILKKTELLVNMALKFNLTTNAELLKRIIELLLEIKDEEYDFFVDLYANISEKPVFTTPEIITQKPFCEFVSVDRKTMGAWKEKYGKKGYDIPFFPSDIEKKPDDIFFSIDAEKYTVPDESYPEKVLDLCENKLHIYYKQKHVNVDVATNAKEAKVTFYLVNRTDTTTYPYTATIKAYDSNGELLCENTVKDYKRGVYVTYKFSGQVKFHISARGSSALSFGELYGVFFD